MSSSVRRWGRPLAIIGTSLLTLVVTVLALLQFPPVATWVMRRLVTVVPLNRGYELEVGSVSGDWLHRLALDDVRLIRNNRELARVERLEAGYDLRQLRGAETRLRELKVDGAQAVARREGGGWDLANALRRSADTTGGGGSFRIERLELRDVQLAAELRPDSALRVRGLSLRARNLMVGEQVLVNLNQLSAAVAAPGSAQWFAVATQGAVTADEFRFDPIRIQTEQSRIVGRAVLPRDLNNPRQVDRLDLRFQATPLALADLAAVVPSVTPVGDLRVEASAEGSGNGLVTARMGARLDEALLSVNAIAPLPNRGVDYRVRAQMRRLDPARLYRAAPSGSLNGTVEMALHGESLETVDGRFALRLTPSRLAGNAVKRLSLRADLRGGSAGLVLRGSLERGTLSAAGQVRPFDSIPQFRLRGTTTGLPGTDAIARALAGDSGWPSLNIRFQLAGAGRATEETRLTGNVILAALRQNGDRVPLGNARITLSRGRLDARPELLVGDGRITAHVIARMGDPLTYEVRRGTIVGVNLVQLSQDSSLAPLSGRFSLKGRGVSPSEVVASGRFELDTVRYDSHQAEQLVGQARLAHGRASLELDARLQGGRLAIEVDGRPLDRSKTFRVRSARLDRADLGSLLGRPDLAGPVTLHASATGRWRGKLRSMWGQVLVAPSRLGRIEVGAGSVDFVLSGERLTYDGSLRTNGGALALAGEGRPFGDVASFVVRRGRADSIDVGTLLGRSDLSTSINARFSGALAGASPESTRADLSLQLLPSRVNRALVQGGRVALQLDQGTLQGDLRLEGRDGALAAKLSGSTSKAMQLRTAGSLRLERLARWTGRPNADGRLESRFDLVAAGDSLGLVSVGGTVDAIGGVGDVRLHALHVALRPEAGAIQVDTLFIRSNAAALDGQGRVALRENAGSDTLRISGITYDVTPVAALAGVDSISLDSARVALTMSGPAWRWRLNAEGQVNGLLAGGNLAERATLRATAALDSTRLSGLRGELRVTDAAYGKVRIPEGRLSLRYDSLLTADMDVAVGDSVRLGAALRGSVGDTIRARLERLDILEGGRDWALEQPAELQLRPGLSVDGLALRAGQRRVILDGVLDLRNTSDIALRVTNVDLEVLRAAGLAPIGGRLDGWLRLAGPAAAPTLEGSIGLGIRRKDGNEIGRLRTDLDWTHEALRIDATAVSREGGRLTLNGMIPWRLVLTPADSGVGVGAARGTGDTLALALRADSFDLRVFDPLLPPKSARDLEGLLVMDARVGGTPEAPRANGTMQVTRAALTVPAIDVSYERGELVGQMTGDELRIERLELRTDDDERLTATGRVRLRPLTDPALDLTAELTDFRISNSPTLRSVASGQLRLEGTAQKPSLSGKLTLGRTDIIVGKSDASPTLEKVELRPEDLRQVARDFGPAVLERAEESPGLTDRFRLDLDLRLPRRVWFRRRESPTADIELSGRIRLRQEPNQPMQFFGRVEPVPGRGRLNVYGAEFRLTGGEIILAGPADSTRLDVTAQYRVPTEGDAEDEGVLIEVAASGPVDSLALEFTGDPEMSQDDVLSYLVTGKPASDNPLAEQATDGESTGERGAAVALSRLTQSLSSAAEEGLGLDVFQVRQEGLHGLTLTAGRYIGSRIFLNLHLPIEFGGEAEQTPGTTLGPTFELEYLAERWLRANVRAGNVPPRFTLRSRYAY